MELFIITPATRHALRADHAVSKAIYSLGFEIEIEIEIGLWCSIYIGLKAYLYLGLIFTMDYAK